MPNFIEEVFLRKQGKLWNLQENFAYVEVKCKVQLKTVKSLNPIFWLNEYW